MDKGESLMVLYHLPNLSVLFLPDVPKGRGERFAILLFKVPGSDENEGSMKNST